MERPLIAINGLYHAEDPMLRLRQRYPDAIRAAGGVPVVLAPWIEEAGADAAGNGADGLAAELESVLGRVDGLLLTGGDDFLAEPLGLGATHPAADATPSAKQRFDLALAAAALERDLPVLGICYGMQCLGLAGGSTLFQDLPSQRPGQLRHAGSALHDVRAHSGTKLAAAAGLGPFPVVSRHHQALRTVPPPWIVSGLDDEYLIEAIERPDLRFAVGVQWHPELSPELLPNDAASSALLRDFVAACRAN